MPFCGLKDVAEDLEAKHYLGASRRGFAYRDEFGIAVFANPSSRQLPQHTWLELVRWCLRGEKNDGSRQWARIAKIFRAAGKYTTVVSYSDPSVGHTGSLYRACNWLWAPTWHRLRPPPSGNGDWGTGLQSVKDRWVFPLSGDLNRVMILTAKDEAILRKRPEYRYKEPGGANYKMFRASWLRKAGEENENSRPY